jgi:hypothetical protein
LGTAGTDEIRAHPWFADIDWNQLLEKKIQAPYIPILDGDGDLKHFSQEFTKKALSPPDSKSLKEMAGDEDKYDGFSYEAELQIQEQPAHEGF